MKNYYQQKKDGWRLEPVIYAKTVKQIQCYRFFEQQIADSPEGRQNVETDQTNRSVAARYIDAIDRGLRGYVPEEYQEAVFAHVADGEEYSRLEDKYFLSVSSMKRYVQAFVCGVAEELGESFRPVRQDGIAPERKKDDAKD